MGGSPTVSRYKRQTVRPVLVNGEEKLGDELKSSKNGPTDPSDVGSTGGCETALSRFLLPSQTTSVHNGQLLRFGQFGVDLTTGTLGLAPVQAHTASG